MKSSCTQDISTIITQLQNVIREARRYNVSFDSKEEELYAFIKNRKDMFLTVIPHEVIMAYVVWKLGRHDSQLDDMICDVCVNADNYIEGADSSDYSSLPSDARHVFVTDVAGKFMLWYCKAAGFQYHDNIADIVIALFQIRRVLCYETLELYRTLGT